MAANNTDQGTRTPPVFIPCRNLPDNTENGIQYTVRELCAAAEKTSGYNSVIGAQKIGGLWRIYPKSADNRAMLLLKGIEVRNLTVNPFDKNPYIVKTPDGEKEVQTTKLIIGNLPISYSNDEIERKLVQLGCEPQSKLMMERDRDERGDLTRWLTGRRFVYIRIPDRALPEKDQYWQHNSNALSSRAEEQTRKLHLLQMLHQRTPSIVLHQRHRLQDLQTAWPQERSSLLPPTHRQQQQQHRGGQATNVRNTGASTGLR